MKGVGRFGDGASFGGKRASITPVASGRAAILSGLTPGRTSLGYVYDNADRPSPHRGESDCAARAIAIATCTPYGEARRMLLAAANQSAFSETGIATVAIHRVLVAMAWRWHPASGRLGDAQLPDGPLVVSVDGPDGGHLTAIVHGVVRDIEDCRSGLLRGFYYRPSFGRSPFP